MRFWRVLLLDMLPGSTCTSAMRSRLSARETSVDRCVRSRLSARETSVDRCVRSRLSARETSVDQCVRSHTSLISWTRNRCARRTSSSGRCRCSTCSSIKPRRSTQPWASCVSALGSTCEWDRIAISAVTSVTCNGSTPSQSRSRQVSPISAVPSVGSCVRSRLSAREISVWEGYEMVFVPFPHIVRSRPCLVRSRT